MHTAKPFAPSDKHAQNRHLLNRRDSLLSHPHPPTPYQYDVEVELKAFVYMLETDVIPKFANDFRGPQTFSVLLDVDSIRMPPLAFLKRAGQVCNDNYPETLGNAAMFPVGWILSAIVRASMAFVPRATREKYILTDDANVLVDRIGVPYADMPAEVHKLVEENKLTAPNK